MCGNEVSWWAQCVMATVRHATSRKAACCCAVQSIAVIYCHQLAVPLASAMATVSAVNPTDNAYGVCAWWAEMQCREENANATVNCIREATHPSKLHSISRAFLHRVS
jgi:hypothetical protein